MAQNKHNFFLGKVFRRSVLLLGALLGFSSSIVAQYGAPMAHYKIKGNIKSKDCNVPVPKLKVMYSEDKNADYYSYPVYTDNSGNFEFNVYSDYYEFPDKTNIYIKAVDEDGTDNCGDFLMLEKKVLLKQIKNQNSYGLQYETTNLEIEYKGNSPCAPQIKKDSILSTDSLKIISSIIKNLQHPSDTILSDSIYTEPAIINDSAGLTTRENPPLSPAENNILIFPNPSEGRYTMQVKLASANHIKVFIYDMNSKLIYSEYLGFVDAINEKMINIETASTGTYLLFIKVGDQVYYEKLIKQ